MLDIVHLCSLTPKKERRHCKDTKISFIANIICYSVERINTEYMR